jgi:oxygen-independent coproporphyrinogen-3 oxidase
MSQARFKILEKYNYQVPRYTSYPPATQFREVPDSGQYARWLSAADKDVSLYIHIPFCARLCHYCGCHMRVVNTYQPVEDYLEVLKSEIALVKRHLPAHVRLSHLHFGGGSPTILKPADFRRLMHHLEENFAFKSGMEIGIEADPRNLSEAKIAAYAKAGVNRLSMGVQDFNEDVLNLINRPQPFHVTYRALQLCKSYGIDNINFDLMYGLPAQTEDSILKTMDMAVSLKPSRIAYFGYAHVPWMKRHMNLMPPDRIPGPKDRYVLQDSGARFLEHAGYTPVGIDHYARPGDALCHALESGTLHRNFQGYTTDRETSLVGLGASSIGAFAGGYVQNRVDTRGYMEEVRAGSLPVHKMLPFKDTDLPARKIIEELMCYLRVDLAAIKDEFSLPGSAFSKLRGLDALEQDGIIHRRGQTITIDPDYRVLARVVCEVFDEYAVKDMTLQRHAQAV